MAWCTQALALIKLPVDNGNSQGFNVSLLAMHHIVGNFLWQKCSSFMYEIRHLYDIHVPNAGFHCVL
jgi:hypothetical protein